LEEGARVREIVYRFSLNQAERTEVSVYGLEGRRHAVILKEYLAAGAHAVRWDGQDSRRVALPAGLYMIVRKRIE
jgi:flagellar hook assembly protein FlgD